MHSITRWGKSFGFMVGVLGLQFFGTLTTFAQDAAPIVKDTKEAKDLMCNVVKAFGNFVLILSILMIIVAAFKYVTAREDAEKVTSAHKTLTWAIIGIVVYILATSVPVVIAEFLGGGAAGKWAC